MFKFFIARFIDLLVHLWSEAAPLKQKRKEFCEKFILKHDLSNKNAKETLEIIKENQRELFENDLSCKECFEILYLPQLKKEFYYLSKEEFDEIEFREYFEMRHNILHTDKF